jgi:hypothetical protein
MILKLCLDNLWTLSFGLSQSHGQSSWLMGEVALSEGDTKFLYAMKLVSLKDLGSIVHLGIIQ